MNVDQRVLNMFDIDQNKPYEIIRAVYYSWVPFDLNDAPREIGFMLHNTMTASGGYRMTNLEYQGQIGKNFLLDAMTLHVRGAALSWMTVRQLYDLMLYSRLRIYVIDKNYGDFPADQVMQTGIFFDPNLVIPRYYAVRIDQTWSEHRLPSLPRTWRTDQMKDFEIGIRLHGTAFRELS